MMIHYASGCILLLAVFFAMLFGGYIYDIPDGEDGTRLGSGEMFDKIAEYYDGMNIVMSLNQHMSWKNQLVGLMRLQAGDHVLDLATGTGDIALLQAQRFRSLLTDAMNNENRDDVAKIMNRVAIIGIDPSKNMLEKAVDKAQEMGHHDIIQFMQGNAMQLEQVKDNSFSKISMSFGIRNVENRTKALLEMRRVLTEREGMTNTDHSLYIMEFVRPTEGALAPLASIFIEYIIPSLGKFVLSLSKLDPTQNPIPLIASLYLFTHFDNFHGIFLLYQQGMFVQQADCLGNTSTCPTASGISLHLKTL